MLNMCNDFEPIRTAFLKNQVLSVLSAVIDAHSGIYAVNSWSWSQPNDHEHERLSIGCVIVEWALKVVEELFRNEDSASYLPPGFMISLFSQLLSSQDDVAASPLSTPYLSSKGESMLDADLEILRLCSELFETLTIDSATARLAIVVDPDGTPTARNFQAPSSLRNAEEAEDDEMSLSVDESGMGEDEIMNLEVDEEEHDSFLSHLLTFIEFGQRPTNWGWDYFASSAQEEKEDRLKVFRESKAAIERAIVVAPTEDEVKDIVLNINRRNAAWRNARGKGKKKEPIRRSWVVDKLVGWLGGDLLDEPMQGDGAEESREDLVICASLTLGNLARGDKECRALLSHYDLATPLARLLKKFASPDYLRPDKSRERFQVLHGVLGLLKNLSLPQVNRPILGNAGVIEAAVYALRPEMDKINPLQVAAIGTLKHLCNDEPRNALRMVKVFPGTENRIAPLELAVALLQRTEDVRLRSEATRLLINVIKSSWSPKPITPNVNGGGNTVESMGVDEKVFIRLKMTRSDVVDAISDMITKNEYPILVMEGVIGLNLLGGVKEGGTFSVLYLFGLCELKNRLKPCSSSIP
ncbi:hypothetical protein BT69DRAFT_210507 [Atractiella rhizophila]|nr:hypothetical protein BT69DRAFT_210507 [Atractiella rhizophila]